MKTDFFCIYIGDNNFSELNKQNILQIIPISREIIFMVNYWRVQSPFGLKPTVVEYNFKMP